MTGFDLPLRIDIANGERLAPTGLDPYALPWVQGAAVTVPLRTRRRYSYQVLDLREKLAVLRSKRAKDDDVPLVAGERREDGRRLIRRGAPTYGPQLRPWQYRSLDQRPGRVA